MGSVGEEEEAQGSEGSSPAESEVRLIDKTIEHKVAEFFSANFELSDDDSKESDFLAAVARQLGGVVAYLGGPAAPKWAAQAVFDEILNDMHRGFDDAQILMRMGGKRVKQ